MNKDFPSNLKVLRKKMSLTQTELAEKLNMSQKAISHYERGDSEPDIDTLIKLSDILLVPIDVLVGKYRLSETTEDIKKPKLDFENKMRKTS